MDRRRTKIAVGHPDPAAQYRIGISANSKRLASLDNCGANNLVLAAGNARRRSS